jgi:alkaline phosphatase D
MTKSANKADIREQVDEQIMREKSSTEIKKIPLDHRSRSLPRRRTLLQSALSLSYIGLTAHAGFSGGVPYLVTNESQRPQSLWGTMVSEVTAQGAIVWSRVDRPSQMIVKWSLDPDLKVSETLSAVIALPQNDLTARVLLKRLPPGRRIFYVVYFESLMHENARSLPLYGEFSTPPNDSYSTVRIAWSGDSFGQGYGINPQFGGVKIYDRIRESGADIFIHCGDRIYADQPLKEMKGGGRGRRWFNLITPEVTKVAETLDEFRGYYRYGLLDHPTKRLAQTMSQLFLWDDHEVKNDWWPGRILKDRRYKERSCDVLATRSRKAFFEYTPLPPSWMRHQRIYRKVSYGPNVEIFALDGRSARGPNDREAHFLNTYERRAQFLGPEQLEWLKGALRASKSRWKVIACPQPLGVVIGSGGLDFDGIASSEREPKGRELELKNLLQFIKREHITDVVWVTADVHYAAAHHFHPSRAVFNDFTPFWEFIAGPLNAATLRANRLDKTFGPERVYLSVPEKRKGGGKSPLDGEQHYGVIEVGPQGATLEVSLFNLEGQKLYSKRLHARA